MLQLLVNKVRPGGVISVSEPTDVTVMASAFSKIPFDRLEIIVNGEIVGATKAAQKNTTAEVNLTRSLNQRSGIAARCIGALNKELFYYNPVFAHTNPIYSRFANRRIVHPESARFLSGFL